ncbi:M1 family aminopeptidase 1 [Nosema bombycis CQ1]|uniref:Aminopeptidase n=1 Tax=Nosema bombycis (strain CQ1 / CVCC 102059) TaxID=578461 RepID=R0MKB8_NOSB1|nr:M1 family aminopeptidase 1 [Nosema bombycis CQ1]|eukprot:EOB13243.1 M1 family aminopeptidase 1 [Nosema bombycis CQ1]
MTDKLDYNVLPEIYNLKIKLEFDYFTGDEEIVVNIKKNTKQFNFYLENIEILDIFYKYEDQLLKPAIKIQEEIATVYFNEELKAHTEGSLCIKYKGFYSEDRSGLKKNVVDVFADDKKFCFYTNFENDSAKRAFPCWGKPDIKAKFNISVCPFRDYIALSNMSVKEIIDGYYVFNTTPKMSIYNVAIVSGKLNRWESKTKRNIPISVFTDHKYKDIIEYALNVAVECLDFFEEYFGINYSLPKLDLVYAANLGLVSIGNWGIALFGLDYIYYYDYKDAKQVAESVCYEISHMWLGNLVTMTNWDDEWWIEGFAGWAASLAMNNISKTLINWNVDLYFLKNNLERGLHNDYIESFLPVSFVFSISSLLDNSKNEITSFKGASLLLMLENYIGKENFKLGFRKFLNKYSYSNATPQDLWNSFDPKFKVESLMNSWTGNKGYPLITIEHDDKEDIKESEYLVIKQKRFLSSDNSTNWAIPITFSWGETILMTQQEIRIKKKSPVYKINMGGSGFYRTLYDLHNLTKLLKSPLNVEDRYNLVSDMFALCNAKMIKVADVLRLCDSINNETDPEVLKIIFYELNEFQSLWYDHKTVLEHLNKTVINLIGSNILNIDIYKEEKNKDVLTYNSLLVTNAIKFNDIRILGRLKAAYTEWWDVNPKFIESVFTSVNNDKYEELFELVDDMDSSHDDKLNALSALAAISCPDNLLNVMRRYHFLSGSFSFYFFFFLGLNEKNREIILDFICDHFDDIRASMRSDYRFSKIIDHVFSRPSTRPSADKLLIYLIRRRLKV